MLISHFSHKQAYRMCMFHISIFLVEGKKDKIGNWEYQVYVKELDMIGILQF